MAGLVRWRLPLGVLLIRRNVLYGGCCALAVLTGSWWTVAVSRLLWGVSYGPEEVVADARVAQETPPHMLGRVYAAWSFVTKAAAGVGYLTAGVVSAYATPAGILLWTGVTYSLVAPATLWLVRWGFERPLRDVTASVPSGRP